MSEDFNSLLENWIRWHARRRPIGQCGSLEGNWRSKQYWDAPPITPLGRVDQLAAQLVEDAWKTLDFFPKMLIKWHYVTTYSPGKICRSFRQKGFSMAPKDYAMSLFRARELFAKAIAYQRDTAHNPRIAVVCEPHPQLEDSAPTEEPGDIQTLPEALVARRIGIRTR